MGGKGDRIGWDGLQAQAVYFVRNFAAEYGFVIDEKEDGVVA